MDRYAWKIVTVKSEVLPVSNSSDDDDDDDELDEFYDSQLRPSLLLRPILRLLDKRTSSGIGDFRRLELVLRLFAFIVSLVAPTYL
jgi:hypothetical protein